METLTLKCNFPLRGMPEEAVDALCKLEIKNAHDDEMGCAVMLEITEPWMVNKVANVISDCGGYSDHGELTQFDLNKLNGVV